MAVSAQGKAAFSDRISRIEKRGAGVAEVFNAGGHRIGGKIAHAPKSTCKNCMIKIPLALLVGVVSVVVAKFAIFSIGPLPESFSAPDYVLGAQVAVALVVIFVARLSLDLTAKRHTLAGVVAMIATMALFHNAVHLLPDVWAIGFSQEWVAEIRASTQPSTLQLRDMVIPLG